MSEKFESLIGKTVKTASKSGSDVVDFLMKDGSKFSIYHDQECCEDVRIHSCGDLESLNGRKIVSASEKTVEPPRDASHDRRDDSETWTEQRINGVKIIWQGSSNGYYGETPSLHLDETLKTVDLEEDLKQETPPLKPTLKRKKA